MSINVVSAKAIIGKNNFLNEAQAKNSLAWAARSTVLDLRRGT
jgi:hypothetical protein